jgi:hypothetical protein
MSWITCGVTSGYLGAVSIATADFRRAAELTQVYPLKAYDAVQLAVAVRYQQSLRQLDLPLPFISGDKVLLNVASNCRQSI